VADQFFILPTVLPECLNRIENDLVFRSVRRPQPDSGPFIESVAGVDPVVRPRTLFAFYDRVPTSQTYHYLTAIYELRDIETNPDEPTWRDGVPNYQLKLEKLKNLDPPIPFGQATPLWETLQTTRGRKIQAFFASSRVLLPIPANDFELITNFVLPEGQEEIIQTGVGTVDEAEAAGVVSPTERLLEDYLVEHLAELEPGLEPFDVNHVRQYGTGDGGRIDIFCKDSEGNPVVVELKRAGAREEVVGQLCRYMGWVMEFAPGATVRGIIVANVIDARLKYAARAVPNVKLVEYHVSFSFNQLG
jgi:hypothetical protein